MLFASRLLAPRESQRISFTAPAKPGVYAYVCTYPGHWRRMYGALYVVADLDEYEANPEAYLAASPLPIKDALLKDRRPRTEWKYDELASALAELSQGRSHAHGKQMFTVAACVACHKLENVGNQFGPESVSLLSFTAGPRFTLLGGDTRVFVRALGGGLRSKASISVFGVTISKSETDFAFLLGGGIDRRLSAHWGLQVSGDYLGVDASDGWQSQPRASIGVSYRFGASSGGGK